MAEISCESFKNLQSNKISIAIAKKNSWYAKNSVKDKKDKQKLLIKKLKFKGKQLIFVKTDDEELIELYGKVLGLKW